MPQLNNSSTEDLFLSLIITSPPGAAELETIINSLCTILDQYLSEHYEIILMDDDQALLSKATELSETCSQLRVFKYDGPTPVATGWEQARGNVLAVVDGDLTQSPTSLSDIIETLKNGSDLAMTSQYREGKLKNGDGTLSFLAVHKDTLPQINESTKGYQLMLEILGPENIKKMTQAGAEEAGQGGRILSHIQAMVGSK